MKDLQEQIVEESFNTAREYLGKLFSPGLEETGGLIKDTIGYWRFKNKINLVLKMKDFLESKNINPMNVLPKILLPIIENGSLEEDPEMQQKWSAMLAHAATPNSEINIKPSYPQILKELSPLEVKILDNFYASIEKIPTEERWKHKLIKEKVLNILAISSEEYDIITDNLIRLKLLEFPTTKGGMTVGDSPFVVYERSALQGTSLGLDFFRSCNYS